MGRTSRTGPDYVGPAPLNGAINQQGQTILKQEVSFLHTAGSPAFQIYLPENSRIVEMYVDVITAWNSATSDLLDVGDGTTQEKYAKNIDLSNQGRVIGSANASDLLTNWRDVGNLRVLTGTVPLRGAFG